jgi:hypothetical protein
LIGFVDDWGLCVPWVTFYWARFRSSVGFPRAG